MKKRFDLDKIDLQILSILSKDAKTSYAEIGKLLFVSGGTVHVRIRKMMEYGIITGSKLSIDYAVLGYDIIAFIGIYLERSQYYKDAALALENIPEVIESHYTTGGYSIFAKLICQDTEHLRKVLSENIQKIEGIERTETFISLEEGINRPPEIYRTDATIESEKKSKLKRARKT